MITLDNNFYTERGDNLWERPIKHTHAHTHICKRKNSYFAIVFSATVVNKKDHGNVDWLGTPIQSEEETYLLLQYEASTEARIFQLMWKTANVMLMNSSIYSAKYVINDFVACRVSTIETLNIQYAVYIMPFIPFGFWGIILLVSDLAPKKCKIWLKVN